MMRERAVARRTARSVRLPLCRSDWISAASAAGDSTRANAAPAENPAAQRPVVAHVHRQAEAAVLGVADLLRRVPDAGADVRRDAGVELDLHLRGGPGVDAERIGEHIVADRLLAA